MTTTITAQDGSGATTTPTLVLGYQTTRPDRTIVHDTLDGGVAFALIPPRPRAGTLQLFYLDEVTAYDAFQLHSRATQFALDSSERPTIAMTYAVTGPLGLELDPDTRNRWTVSVPYQEATA